MNNIKAGDRVLITGGSGSLGYALTEALYETGVAIRIFSRDEKKQYEMRRTYPGCDFRLGDIRDPVAVRDAIRDIDIVIHGASLKYVNIGELQPYEYVVTNIGGTLTLLDAILAGSEVRRCVGISSDKACMPINTYGMTKAVLERLTLEANDRQGSGEAAFTIARYGNVAGTRGSVIPFWRDRIADGQSLLVTNPEMTRFFFTLDEAVDLIDQALMVPAGMMVSKRMSACTIGDLAEVMAAGVHDVEIIGERPGEKRHEMLLTSLELSKTLLRDEIFIHDPVAPALGDPEPFTSDVAPQLDRTEIATLLEKM